MCAAPNGNPCAPRKPGERNAARLRAWWAAADDNGVKPLAVFPNGGVISFGLSEPVECKNGLPRLLMIL